MENHEEGKKKKKTSLLQRTMNAYLRNSALTKPQYRPAE